MKITGNKIVTCCVVWIFLLSLTACATTKGNVANHSFSFDATEDSPDIDVLDYQYGSSKRFGTYGQHGGALGHDAFGHWSTYGAMPRGEFLYVKWRVKKTGKVFEDRADLTHCLPDDMDGLNLHFVVRGEQLYVFVIWPWDGKPWTPEPKENRYLPVPGGAKRFEGSKILQVYPDPKQSSPDATK